MARSLFSSSWYRVADLKPRLRIQAQFHRQRFRNATWFVLQDHQSGHNYRLSPTAHRMVSLMDGRRTVREIWEKIGGEVRDGEDQPTQDEAIQLLSQLHGSDLLQGGMPPDMDELSDRAETQQRKMLMSRIKNPLALRFPLLDPDRFLSATLPLARPFFTIYGLIVWAALIVVGSALAIVNWDAMGADLTTNAFTTQNIALALVIYPLIKALHELGHGYAIRVWGGEVHEMGVMMLVLMPVPYVDATSAAAFPQKWRRAVVSGAGIMVEAALASIAMIFWVILEPGLAKAIAFNVMLIGGVSTLLFNGNPLLRFDGYYVFADLIEIPNLAARANRFFFYTIRRRLFGMTEETPQHMAPGEARWFLFYSVAAFLYRISIMITIALFVASQFFFIGIMLAILVLVNTIIWPLMKGIRYLTTDTALQKHRNRAYGVTGAVTGLVLILLLLVPLPYATVVQGVVRLPDQAAVAAPVDGFLDRIITADGEPVTAGQPLLQLKNIELETELAVARGDLEQFELQRQAIELTDRSRALLLGQQVRQAEEAVASLEARLARLVITAEKDGRFILPAAADLPGRMVTRGQTMGYVVNQSDPVVRVVVDQADVDLVRQRTGKITARRAEALSRTVTATFQRQVPQADARLPSAALGTSGGGNVILDPTSAETPQALEGLFLFDLALVDQPERILIGGRVHVRFDHGTEPLAFRLSRAVRQLFLRQFGV